LPCTHTNTSNNNIAIIIIIITNTEGKLEMQLQVVKETWAKYSMEIGLYKCAKWYRIQQRRMSVRWSIPEIQELGQTMLCKYLGNKEGEAVQHERMKEKLKKEIDLNWKMRLS
jgi:hypothetical protein